MSIVIVASRARATMIEPEEAAVFRVMVRQAREVIVVADSIKMGMVSPAVIFIPRDIDLLITDDGSSWTPCVRLRPPASAL